MEVFGRRKCCGALVMVLCMILCILFASAKAQAEGSPVTHEEAIRNASLPSMDDEASESDPDDMWRPIRKEPKTIAGLALAAFFVMVAAGSGLGGGGILVPLYMLMLDIDPMFSVALSNITILGASLMNVMINSYRRHPIGDRPMINWEVVMVMEPASILGTVFGGVLNKVSPSELTTILMIVFLMWTTIRTFKKARKLYSIESQATSSSFGVKVSQMKHVMSDSVLSESFLNKDNTIEESRKRRAISLLDFSIDEDNLTSPIYNTVYSDDLKISKRTDNAKERPELLSLYEKERASCPIEKVLPMVMLQLAVITLFVGKQLSKCGKPLFWIITASFIPLTMIFMFFVRRYLLHLHEKRLSCNYEFLDGDVKWNTKTTVWFPLICVNAGIIASWFGLGGGTVKGPLMLEMGILPEVTAATSSTMMAFTSLSAVTGYIAMDRVLVYYGIFVFFMGAICTLIAQMILKHYIDRLKRPSLVIYLFATVCLLGVLSMLLASRRDILNLFKGDIEGFNPICK